jgi:hypothetical protein
MLIYSVSAHLVRFADSDLAVPSMHEDGHRMRVPTLLHSPQNCTPLRTRTTSATQCHRPMSRVIHLERYHASQAIAMLPWGLGRPLLLLLCFLSPSTKETTSANTFAAPTPAAATVGSRSTECSARAITTVTPSKRERIRGEFRWVRPRWRRCSRDGEC